MLENRVARVDYLLAKIPAQDPDGQPPAGEKLAAWAAREAGHVLAAASELERAYPDDTNYAHRAVRDARSQAEAALRDLSAGWGARAWGLVVSARADLEAAPQWAHLPTPPGDGRGAVTWESIVALRAQVLDELAELVQRRIPGTRRTLVDQPWFADQLRTAARRVANGDTELRRYGEDPDPASWLHASQNAYREYVRAFAAVRRAQIALRSFADAGIEFGR